MILAAADPTKNLLTLTLSGHIVPEEASAFLEERLPEELLRLKPDFDLINDIRDLMPTDAQGLQVLQQAHAYLLGRGLGRAVRVTRLPITTLQFERVSQTTGLRTIQAISCEEAMQILESPEDRFGGDPVQDWATERRFRRISTGPDHTVCFRAGGLDFPSTRILNLSAQGCFAVLPSALGDQFTEGTILVDFRLEHADLPQTPFSSRVVRIVRGISELAPGDVGLGIHFLNNSPAFIEWIEAYVSAWGLETSGR